MRVPPRIQSANRSAAEVKLTWDALPDRTYRVQYRDSLSETTWTVVAEDVSGSPFGAASKTVTTLGNPSQRFYRVVLLP